MSWGDPFDKLYIDDDVDQRTSNVVASGILPGTMVTYGVEGGLAIRVWSAPDLKADGFEVVPGHGMVMAIDCASDPTTDWIMVLFNFTSGRQTFCWLPTSMVRKA